MIFEKKFFLLFLWKFWNYLTKLGLKNCKISGNFGDLEILTDGTVPETVETLVKKESTTENKSAGLDYTAFMVNKEKSSKHINKKRTASFLVWNWIYWFVIIVSVTFQCDAKIELKDSSET